MTKCNAWQEAQRLDWTLHHFSMEGAEEGNQWVLAEEITTKNVPKGKEQL